VAFPKGTVTEALSSTGSGVSPLARWHTEHFP
jgi:hypothetical protein